jgi:hypothetical protein
MGKIKMPIRFCISIDTISSSGVAALCDLNTKNDAYLNYIIGILKENNKNSKAIIGKIDK